MLKNGCTKRWVLAAIFLMSMHGVASAQATRTWVSGVGDDANPCSRTAPCKTFAGAISKTAAGGEISVLDPGGFGAVTITKAITIDGAGTLASTLNAASNGFVINAGVADKVVLRNLTINGAGSGLNGIKFLAGESLLVDNVRITGNNAASPNGVGILFLPAGASRLIVTNSVIANNITGGILVAPSGTGTAQVTVTGTQLSGGAFGLRTQDRTMAVVSDCVVTGNPNQGVVAVSTSQYVDITVTGSTLNDNGFGAANAGAIQSTGPAAIIRIAGNNITNNQYGLWATGGGQILSFGSNEVTDNDTDGNPTGTLTTR